MASLEFVERDPARAGIVDRTPLRRIGEEIEAAVDNDSPAGSTIEKQRAGPDVVVIDPRRSGKLFAKGAHAVDRDLAIDDRPEARGVGRDDDG